MFGTIMFISIALFIGELVCGAIVKKLKNGDEHFAKAARASFNVVMGILMHEYVKIQMYVVDGYSWE